MVARAALDRGNVIFVSMVKSLAPSSAADSYRLSGTDWKEVRSTIML